jgi:hypothetical protein
MTDLIVSLVGTSAGARGESLHKSRRVAAAWAKRGRMRPPDLVRELPRMAAMNRNRRARVPGLPALAALRESHGHPAVR